MAFPKLAPNTEAKGRCRPRVETLFLTEWHKAPTQAYLVQLLSQSLEL